MGIGRASGENRATIAAQQAIESPLIEVSIDGARGVLLSVIGGYDLSMAEINEAAELVTASISPDANIIWGAAIRPELEDEVIVTVVATGFDSQYYSNDPRALQDTYVSDLNSSVEPVSAPTQAAADPIQNMPVEEPAAAAEIQPETQASAVFTNNDNVNMWDQIRNDSDDDDSDIPAILRRRKKNKD
jgi:cell division protein FtsZ